MDEAGFCPRDVERLFGYAPKGQKIHDQVSGKRGIRQSIIAAMCQGKFLAPKVYEKSMNGEKFLKWAEESLLPCMKKEQVLILDNAKFHKKKDLINLIESIGCKVIFLPPYSPNFNDIEQGWAWIKAGLKRITDCVDPLPKKILSLIKKYSHLEN